MNSKLLQHKRYSDLPFPPYAFIPGQNPHPQRDPQGHSHGQPEEKPAYLEPARWQENKNYLFGIDLYNHGFWWESHEKWEAVWHTTEKEKIYGQHLQGLIQVSAAFIKWHLHQHEGLKKLFEIGIERLEFVQKTSPAFMGLDLTEHVSKLKKHFQPVLTQADFWPDPLNDYPYIELKEGPC